MRLIADGNFPLPTIEALRRAGHVDRAETEGRILLTLDKDFWQIAIQRRRPLRQNGVILFRAHPAIPENVTPPVLRTVGADGGWAGHASAVTVDRVLMVRSGNPATR